MYKNICEKELYQSDGEDHPHIKILKSRFSEILFKSFFDYFSYDILLDNGKIISFGQAKPTDNDNFIQVQNFKDERWLEVNINKIVLIAENGNKYQSVYKEW